jgi:spore coat-associated protein N
MSTTRPPEAPEREEPGARKRAGYLLRHAKLWIAALILLAIALIVATTSFGLFTTSEASAGNVAATGNLEISGGDKVIFNETGMVPGDSITGTVTIENTGDVDGSFRLDAGSPQDTGSPALSGVLRLRIDEMSAATGGSVTGTPYPTGPFASQPDNLDLGEWTPGTRKYYRFTVSLPSDAGNEFEGARTEVTYTWSATAGS